MKLYSINLKNIIFIFEKYFVIIILSYLWINLMILTEDYKFSNFFSKVSNKKQNRQNLFLYDFSLSTYINASQFHLQINVHSPQYKRALQLRSEFFIEKLVTGTLSFVRLPRCWRSRRKLWIHEVRNRGKYFAVVLISNIAGSFLMINKWGQPNTGEGASYYINTYKCK